MGPPGRGAAAVFHVEHRPEAIGGRARRRVRSGSGGPGGCIARRRREAPWSWASTGGNAARRRPVVASRTSPCARPPSLDAARAASKSPSVTPRPSDQVPGRVPGKAAGGRRRRSWRGRRARRRAPSGCRAAAERGSTNRLEAPRCLASWPESRGEGAWQGVRSAGRCRLGFPVKPANRRRRERGPPAARGEVASARPWSPAPPGGRR
jgi:hypothetical protein